MCSRQNFRNFHRSSRVCLRHCHTRSMCSIHYIDCAAADFSCILHLELLHRHFSSTPTLVVCKLIIVSFIFAVTAKEFGTWLWELQHKIYFLSLYFLPEPKQICDQLREKQKINTLINKETQMSTIEICFNAITQIFPL